MAVHTATAIPIRTAQLRNLDARSVSMSNSPPLRLQRYRRLRLVARGREVPSQSVVGAQRGLGTLRLPPAAGLNGGDDASHCLFRSQRDSIVI